MHVYKVPRSQGLAGAVSSCRSQCCVVVSVGSGAAARVPDWPGAHELPGPARAAPPLGVLVSPSVNGDIPQSAPTSVGLWKEFMNRRGLEWGPAHVRTQETVAVPAYLCWGTVHTVEDRRAQVLAHAHAQACTHTPHTCTQSRHTPPLPLLENSPLLIDRNLSRLVGPYSSPPNHSAF